MIREMRKNCSTMRILRRGVCRFFFCRNFTIQKLLPRYLHVKAKAKPEEITAFQTGSSSAFFFVHSKSFVL